MFDSKFKIAGVFNRSGMSRQNKPYSIYVAVCLEPIVIYGSLVNGSGYRSREIDCDEEVFSQLSNCKFPLDVEAYCLLGYENKIRISSLKSAPPKSASKPSSALRSS